MRKIWQNIAQINYVEFNYEIYVGLHTLQYCTFKVINGQLQLWQTELVLYYRCTDIIHHALSINGSEDPIEPTKSGGVNDESIYDLLKLVS